MGKHKLLFWLFLTMLMATMGFSIVGVGTSQSSSTTWTVEVGGGFPLFLGIPGITPVTGAVDFHAYDPSTIVIKEGDTINWTMSSNAIAPHTVTHHPATGEPVFDSSPWVNETSFAPVMAVSIDLLFAGQAFSHTFNTPGNYTIFCKLHPLMTGVVNVTTTQAPENTIVYATAGSGTAELDIMAFIPYQLIINNGTTVVWTNENPFEPHTVTHKNQTVPREFDSSPTHPDTIEELIPLAPGLVVPGKGLLFSPTIPFPPGIEPSSSYDFKFDTPGIYHYHCTIHPGMEGTVIVLPLLEDDITTLQSDLDTAQSDLATAQGDLSTAQSDITKLQSDLDDANGQINTLTTVAYAAIAVGVIGIIVGAWSLVRKKS